MKLRVLLGSRNARFNNANRAASVPKHSPTYWMIGIDTDPGLPAHRTSPWPDDDPRIDQNDPCVVDSHRDRRQSVPNGCCRLDRLEILGPFGCRPEWTSNQRDHRCTVLCCWSPPPAWARTPMSHQLGHRCSVRLDLEGLSWRGLLAGLQPWHRHVEPFRRPRWTRQCHVVSSVRPHGTTHDSCSYQLVVEPLNDPISTFLSLELDLSDHYWVGLDDPALADKPTDGHHRTLKVTSRRSGREILCYDHEWPSESSYGYTGVQGLWRWSCCYLLESSAAFPASQARIGVEIHLSCQCRVVLRL